MYRLPNCPSLIIWSDVISELQYNTNISVGSKSTRNTVFDLMLNIANQNERWLAVVLTRMETNNAPADQVL